MGRVWERIEDVGEDRVTGSNRGNLIQFILQEEQGKEVGERARG